jgi:hypothetical protein
MLQLFQLKKFGVGVSSRLAAMERSRCLITETILVLLLKSNISSLEDQVYNNDDMELIVKHYLGFLVACAAQTNRLNAKLVAFSAKEVFGCSDFIGKKFGEAMACALSYCQNKAGKATSGKKLSQNVKTVILSFSHTSAGMNKVQESLKLPVSPSAKPSNNMSPPGNAGSPQMLEPAVASSSAREIYNLYGISDLPKIKKPRVAEETVLSSQEIFSSQEHREPPQALRSQANNETSCFGNVSPNQETIITTDMFVIVKATAEKTPAPENDCLSTPVFRT